MGAYTLLQDLTVATNSTSVVLDDFGTITKDDFVKVVVTLVVTIGNDVNLGLTANSSTAANHHTQQLSGDGSTVNASRFNSANFLYCDSTGASALGYLKLSENDRSNFFANGFVNTNGTLVRNLFRYVTSSGATFTSGITSLTFTASRTNGIGTGSRIQIYKLAATKVADITVATTTGQVDISSLSIDKDSEYLLVSDMIANSAGCGEYNLFINDNTTSSNYYYQVIRADGSNASAVRVNQPGFSAMCFTGRTLAYTFIKLSNIGAYTFQSYSQRNAQTSGLMIENYMTSSTAENITSITKLNITGSIASGSRFILYKLYE